jgi:hypothetical protein
MEIVIAASRYINILNMRDYTPNGWTGQALTRSIWDAGAYLFRRGVRGAENPLMWRGFKNRGMAVGAYTVMNSTEFTIGMLVAFRGYPDPIQPEPNGLTGYNRNAGGN